MVLFMSDRCWNMIQRMGAMTKMNFEQIVISISGVLYFSVGVSYLLKQQYAWAMVWFAYSMANVGLMLAAKKV